MSWSRRHLWHWWLLRDNITNLLKLSKRCRWWCGCRGVSFGHHNCQNLPFCCPVLHFSLEDIVNSIPPSGLCQSVKHHILLPETLHMILYCFGDCTYHQAGFIIFSHLAKLSIFFIILLNFRIVFIVGTCKIDNTVSDRIQYLLPCLFRLSGCRSCLLSISHMFLLLHYRCLCISNSHCCHSGLCIHIILNPFHFHFVAYTVRFPHVLYHKLLFGW